MEITKVLKYVLLFVVYIPNNKIVSALLKNHLKTAELLQISVVSQWFV